MGYKHWWETRCNFKQDKTDVMDAKILKSGSDWGYGEGYIWEDFKIWQTEIQILKIFK